MASKPGGKRASIVSVKGIGTGETQEKEKTATLKGKLSLGNVSFSNQGSWSLSGLLAAQRMTKNLKGRRAQKIKKTEIVTPQPPSFASRPSEKVRVTAIKSILEKYLPDRLGQLTYDPKNVPILVKEVSEEVRTQVKHVLPPRYKALCVVTLGERAQEDIAVVSRCLWDPHADSYAAHVYQNQSIFCVVAVYVVYFE
ncbi:dynein light chain Tctex-type 5-like [Bombina bombina]|uniref:dynein light chain Tctex-type 5-like n=1 Tax=Bombina bombina TaxID=8345 RepID=UPI00235AFCCC|nr:dynein light chain Tctex-type 5-like [Bombina bombina]